MLIYWSPSDLYAHRDIVVWRTQYESSKTWGILGNISPLSILPRFTGPSQKSTGTFWTVCVGTNIMMDYLISDWSTQNNRALSHEHRGGGRCGLIRGIFLLWVSLWGGMMQSTWNKPQNTETLLHSLNDHVAPLSSWTGSSLHSLLQWCDIHPKLF